MRVKYEYPTVFLIGAVCYGFMELLFRGHTHWTMFIMGGLCFSLLYILNNYNKLSMPQKWIIGSIMITAVEFFAGGLLNLTLGLRVWTYSKYPMNIMGQICILFSLLWFFICIPASWLSVRLKKLMSNMK